MNNQENEIKKFSIDARRLPEFYPTHSHPAEFWEQLGRTIATFGYLEEVLGKAIFAFTATRQYNSIEEAEGAYNKWLSRLTSALTDQLSNLSVSYSKAVRDHQNSGDVSVDKLVEAIKEATNIRNVLCHGSWRAPDTTGKSLPLYVSRKGEIFDTPIDTDFLKQTSRHVAELSCEVINSVTQMGFQFPGSAGPGKKIWLIT